jgi:hypothetical protein
MLPEPLDATDSVLIEVPDRWDVLTTASVWMTEPDVQVDDPQAVGDPLALDSGRKVWVTAGHEQLPSADPMSEAVGSMIEPRWPEEHGTAAPGILIRGVVSGAEDQ